MRRIILPLAAVAAAYCAYLTTVSPPVALPASSDGGTQTRLTREINMPARSLYAACLGRYDDIDEARVEAARLSQRGAAGFVREDGGDFAVVGALYEAQGDALSVCRRIEMSEGMETGVMLCASDALRLRVTAGEDQINAMEDALQALEEIPPELNALSYSLDGGEMTGDTARSLLHVLHTRAARADDALRSAAGDTQDKFCTLLMEISGEMRASLEFLCSDSGPGGLALSSAMKNTAVSAMLGVSDMMDDLR